MIEKNPGHSTPDISKIPAESGPNEPGGRPRVWGPWATVALGVAVEIANFLVQLFVVIGFAVVLLLSSSFTELADVEGFVISISVILGAFMSVGLIILFIRMRKGAPVADYLGTKKISFKTILVSLAAMLVFLVVTGLVSSALDRTGPQSVIDQYRTSVFPALFWLAVVIFGPIAEETLFRGFLFKGLSESRLGVFGTVILTASPVAYKVWL